MNCITQSGQWELRVDIPNKTKSYLHYNMFRVGSASKEYPLTVGGFTSIIPNDPFTTTGNSFNGQRFSTNDNDNDN